MMARGSSKPDFVVVSARLGVLIIEVKDWSAIEGGTQEQIVTISQGARVARPNPILQAEQYAYALKDRFSTRAELWEQRRGRPALRFPWQVMVALPNIPQAQIERFEAAGIWPGHTVVGADHLRDAGTLEAAIRALPWKFTLDRPLTLDMLDIVREVIDPSLSITDSDGRAIGVLTRPQKSLIDEPIRIFQPKQATLIGEFELPPDHGALVDSTEVRLVRGVAGSGKTLVLLRRYQRLKELYPDASTLVLTFNRELARALMTATGEEPSLVPHDAAGDDDETRPIIDADTAVRTFHSICREILGESWQLPINGRRWLSRNESAAIAALGMPVEEVARELAWRREMNIASDAAYLTAERRGRGFKLDQAKRAQINAIAARYEAAKRRKMLAGKAGHDWDEVAFLAERALDTPGHPLAGAFDAIFIDEGQDFTPSWMRVVRRLLRRDGALFICDDPTQSIFHSYSWVQKGVPVVGRTVHLRVPFRSTMEISEAAHRLIEADDILRAIEERSEVDFTSYQLGRGPLPGFILTATEADERAVISAHIDDLLADGTPARSIAVLCHHPKDVNHWKDYARRGVYVQFFEKMKGLEFVNVFVPHLERAFDSAPDDESIAIVRRKIFTAMTRARYRLTLSAVGTVPAPLHPLIDLMTMVSYTPV
jgi:hypothetical protein